MISNIEDVAYEAVLNSPKPWFTTDDIKKNLETEGFVINNKIIDHYSSLIYTKDKEIKIISIKDDLVENKLRKILLMYYGCYKLNPVEGNGFVKIYDAKNIKNDYKRLGNLIQDYSVEKEFNQEEFNTLGKQIIKKR